MKSIFRLGLVVLVALVALSAVASASASPVWKVEGHALASGESEALSNTVTVKKHFLFTQNPGPHPEGWQAECTALTLSVAKLKGPSAFAASWLKFTGCATTTHSAECEVGQGNQFQTSAVTGVLEGSTSAQLKIVPAVGSSFAQLEIRNKPLKKCLWQQVAKLTGYMLAEIPLAASEAVGHSLTYKEPNGLEWFAEPLGFTGEGEITLASGKKWSAG